VASDPYRFNLMSRFQVDLSGSGAGEDTATVRSPDEPVFNSGGSFGEAKRRGKSAKIFKMLGVSLLALLLVIAVGGYFYLRSLRTTPQYSLALLVDAARRDDQKTIDELIDTDAIVDDFMPQITDKAVELYGRGLPPAVIQKVAQVAMPLIPTIKQRARAEVPSALREKTKPFENIPFWAIVLGASRYLDISQDGDKAVVKSKLADKPLELTMKRNGERWQVVGIRDDALAKKIAEKIGQDLISKAKKVGAKKAGEQLGLEGLDDILNNSEIFK
jgi:hypothetical protein